MKQNNTTVDEKGSILFTPSGGNMKISTEEELVKEAYRLSKEVEDLAAYKPGKEEVAKRIERIIEKLKEGKMTLSPPLTKYIL